MTAATIIKGNLRADPLEQFTLFQTDVRYTTQDALTYRATILGFDAEQPDELVWIDVQNDYRLVHRHRLDTPATDGWGNWLN